jgi:hypothetical protein
MSNQSWTKTCGFCKHTFGGPGLIGGDCPNCPKPTDEAFPNGIVARGMAPIGYVSSGWVENPNVDPQTREEAARIRAQQGLQNPQVLGTKMDQRLLNSQFQQSQPQMNGKNGVMHNALPMSSAMPQQPQYYQQPPMQQQISSTTAELILVELRRIADAMERISPPQRTKIEDAAESMMSKLLLSAGSVFGEKQTTTEVTQ